MEHFIKESQQHKKGYIFVYHHSSHSQQFEFDLHPHISLSFKEFKAMEEKLPKDISYIVIPLLLADGYMYDKLRKMTTLPIAPALINSDEDISRLMNICRKEGVINLWMLHSRSQGNLLERFKLYLKPEERILLVDDPIDLDKDQTYHMTIVLMTKGDHYHEVMEDVSNVTVSDILTNMKEIKAWIYENVRAFEEELEKKR